MTHLTAEQTKALTGQLEARAQVLRAENAAALHHPSGRLRLANQIENVDDQPVASLENAIDIAALERDVVELRETESALERMRADAYGACADCGADIPYARLSANPAAVRCIACQERHEHGRAPGSTL